MTFDEWWDSNRFEGLGLKSAAAFAWGAAQEAEREACAAVCDELHHPWRFGDGDDSASGPKECANAIRERKDCCK